MKKILIIPGYKIFPMSNGGSVAQSVFIDSLKKYFEVHIFVTSKNIDYEEINNFKNLFANVKFHFFDISKTNFKTKIKTKIRKFKTKIFKTLKIQLSKPPTYNKTNIDLNNIKSIFHKIRSLYEIDFITAERISQIIENENIDILQTEMDYNLSLSNFIENKKLKKIFIHHELITEKMIDELSYYKHLADDYSNFLIETANKLETHNLNLYDRVVTFNSHDTSILDSKLNKKTLISPFPITNQKLENIFDSKSENLNLIFLGGGDHIPNKHGLEWFLDYVFEEIEKSLKNIKLFITGSWSISFKNHYNSKNIIFTNYISNEQLDNILSSSILISPIFMGSGLRVKILTAMSKGIPVISTPKGAAGIPNLISGENIIISESSNSWKLDILNTLKNNVLLKKISENSYNLYYQEFDYEKLFLQRLEIYKNLF